MNRVNVRERIPLKQGLKPYLFNTPSDWDIFVRERIPLKQGLKLKIPANCQERQNGQREDSIKTRIETCPFVGLVLGLYDCQREDSIKTRIETTVSDRVIDPGCLVRERIPLKQGLKHKLDRFKSLGNASQREDSIKTRIETISSVSVKMKFFWVRERIPLKQGLKLLFSPSTIS